MCLAVIHTPGGSGVGFAARQLSPSPGFPFTTASACPAGPAGDSIDASDPPHAHPGASADRHVHAGEVSWGQPEQRGYFWGGGVEGRGLAGPGQGTEEQLVAGQFCSDSPSQCYWTL